VDKRTFWATKSPQAVYEAVTLSHSVFTSPIRLVRDKFDPVTLGGFVHLPVPMTITTPEQRGSSQPRLRLSFPRAVVGRQVKQYLKDIVRSGSRDPITIAYALYLDSTDVPQATWMLYAADQGGVNFSTDQVQINATLENVMRRAVAPIYTPEQFSGLSGL
jgi:hypothetical protein